MTPVLEIHNSQSKITGLDPDTLKALQRIVSYRARDLPPKHIQSMIKEYMGRHRPRGGEVDLRGFLLQHGSELGVWAQQLTPNMFRQAFYSKGFWDGWTSLVSSRGFFGTGLLPLVKRTLTLRLDLDYQEVDRRPWPPPSTQGFARVPEPDLYDFQREAIQAWLDAGGRGVIDLPPRSGKTRIMIAALQRLMLPALVVVPTVGLVEQTRARFLELGWPDDQVIGLTGGRAKMTAKMQRRLQYALVWIMTPGTAAGSRKAGNPGIEGIRSRQVLILDEFHHCFSPDTPVMTAKGWVRIQDVVPGMWVLSSQQNGGVCYSRVTRVWRRPAPTTWLKITTSLGAVEVTDEHRIYTPAGQRRASELRVGDLVRGLWASPAQGSQGDVCLVPDVDLGSEGVVAVAPRMVGAQSAERRSASGDRLVEGVVLSIERVWARSASVYDLEVERTHNYIANGLLVSNSAAKTYRAISDAAVNACYRMGCTGTHFRSDGKDMLMHSVLSRAVYSKSIEEMVALGRLVPGRVGMPRVPWGVIPDGRLYTHGITDFDNRNAILIQAAKRLISHGKRVLVLAKEVEHSRNLAYWIGMGAVQVDGRNNSQVRPALDDLEAGKVPCVVGTSVIGEGRDVPRADALVYAAGGKSKVKTTQDFFRCLTVSEGKQRGVIVDPADTHHHRLTEFAAHRLAIYRRCFDAEVMDPGNLEAWVDQAVRGSAGGT